MKIIHCSGNSCKEDIEKYLQAGSNKVVGKPLPIKELDNIVYNLLY